MRYHQRSRRNAVIMLVLVCLAVAMGAWALIGQVRVSALNARIAELEAALQAQQTPEETVQADSNVNLDAIAAEFDGGVVTVAEAIEEYNMIAAYYEMMGMDEADYAENAKITVLDGLIEGKILENKAREAGVYELTAEQQAEIEARVQAEYEDNINYYMAFRFDESKTDEQVREETITYLNENGYSYESMLEDARQNAWQDQLYTHITRDMAVTDEQMREFYESQITSAELTYSADFSAYEMDSLGGGIVVWHPEGVREVQAILVSFSDDQAVEYLTLQAAIENGDSTQLDALEALYNALEPKAQEALERAAAGEDFQALMAEYGDAGFSCVSEQSTLCGDAFRDAAMALANPGDISGLVQTDGGLCIIRYVGDVPAGRVAYEDVRDELLVNYEAELKSSLYNATVVGWLQEANVKYYTDRF